MAKHDPDLTNDDKARWYYIEPHQRTPSGPLTTRELGNLIGNCQVHQYARVWKPGMSAWTELTGIKEFQATVPSANPERSPISPPVTQNGVPLDTR